MRPGTKKRSSFCWSIKRMDAPQSHMTTRATTWKP